MPRSATSPDTKPAATLQGPLSPEQVAEAVRAACVAAACDAYEDAGLHGLCAEGRWEVAVGAMQSLDLTTVLRAALAPAQPEAGRPHA